MRRLLRIAIRLALLAGVAYAIKRLLEEPAPAPAPGPATGDGWRPVETPPRLAEAPAEPTPAWVLPDAEGCPEGYPVKAKMTSKIFHLPGMQAYDRTKPDRCYADAAAAEADGLRPAKR